MKTFLLSIIITAVSICYTQTDECLSFLDSISGKEVYQFVDKMPEFPGGQDSLHQFIIENIEYPPILCVSGTVYFSFIVSQDGSLSDFRILKPGSSFDQNVEDLFAKFPDWIPGECNGEKVACILILPIKFKLH